MKRLSLSIVIILFPVWLFGANPYWVSPTGAASFAAAQSATPLSGTACTTVALAFANATAGAVVNFRGGTYVVPVKNFGDSYTGYYSPAHSGTAGNYITFQAYPGETPLFNGTTGGLDPSYYETMFGFNDAYIIFDGFSLQCNSGSAMARIVVGFQYDLSNRNQSSYVTIKNCTFYGGTTIPASTDNLEGLRIEESNNTTIQNCTFYSYTNSTGSHNTSAIKVYDSNYITVTNCVIYDSLVGIFYKRAADYVTTTNNFFHDMDQDGVLLTQSTGVNMTDHIFNNNLFINCGTAGIQLSGQDGNYLTNLTVYNNTFYNTTYGVDDHSATTVNHRYYNNISQSNSWAFAYPPPAGLLECDYNNNGSTSFTILYNSTYRQGGTSVSSFTNWKATTAVNGGNPDTHGYTSNPVFRNTSGNLNTIADFEPTSSDCIGKGKGGANIGADVSLVGTGSTGGSTPTAPTSVPTIGIGGFRTW